MKTLVVELYGGPGIGKTTFAAKLFAALKDHKTYSVESVGEYVKTWAWEGKHPTGVPDQVYLFAKQLRAESRLYGKVDIVVTDAPVVLMPYYAKKYIPGFTSHALMKLYKEVVFDSCSEVHRHRLFLDRVKTYDPRGRFQTEDQAREIDDELREFLEDVGLDFVDVPPSTDKAVEAVLRLAAQVHGR